MTCDLEVHPSKTFPGTTLFSKRGARCIKATAVYLSAAPAADTRKLNIVLWVHGWAVTDHQYLLLGDASQLREQVRQSNKDVVLVAPFLGHKYRDKDRVVHGSLDVAAMAGAKWGEGYLDEVLAALALHLNPKQPPALQIGSLVLACHSGGGEGMRYLYGTLGKYRSNLKECWGFDCLYGANASPDDATFWHNTMLSKDALPLYFYYGPSTLPQSVKLDLMARGMADARGNRADPPTHTPMQALQVAIGQPLVGGVDALMFPTAPAAPPPRKPPRKPPAKSPKPVDGQYVERAATNLKASAKFGDIHYKIARDFFRARLDAAGFL